MKISRIFYSFPASRYLLLALLFFGGLELIGAFHRYIILFSGALLALLAYGIALIRYEEKYSSPNESTFTEKQFHPLQLILPVLTAAGLVGFALFLPSNSIAHVYYIGAAIVFYWLLANGSRQAYPTWNWALSTGVYFVDVAVILGLAFNLAWPPLLTVALVFLVTWLISIQAFHRIIPTTSTTVLVSLAMGFVLAQLAWVMQFLPAHWLVLAGVLVVIYYTTFHLLSISYERALRRRDVLEYAGIALAALFVLLTTARWF